MHQSTACWNEEAPQHAKCDISEIYMHVSVTISAQYFHELFKDYYKPLPGIDIKMI